MSNCKVSWGIGLFLVPVHGCLCVCYMGLELVERQEYTLDRIHCRQVPNLTQDTYTIFSHTSRRDFEYLQTTQTATPCWILTTKLLHIFASGNSVNTKQFFLYSSTSSNLWSSKPETCWWKLQGTDMATWNPRELVNRFFYMEKFSMLSYWIGKMIQRLQDQSIKESVTTLRLQL